MKIANQTEYDNAVKRMNKLIKLDPTPGTPEYKELDELGTALAEYEEVHYPIEEVDEDDDDDYVDDNYF